MNKNVNHPFAVITGASSGIGFELAKQFAQHGFDLLIVSDTAKITKAAQQLCYEGFQVQSLQTDLSQPEGVEDLYNCIKATSSHIDAIAINAGIGMGGAFAETDLSSEFEIVDLNITSAVHLTKYIVQDMIIQGFGKILFTASLAATDPFPYQAVYSASKAFLYSFSQSLRYELKDYPEITVTTLLPDITDTPFLERAGLYQSALGRSIKEDPALVAEQGFKALMANSAFAFTGSMKSKAKNSLSNFLSVQTKARIHGELSKPDNLKNS